MASSEPVLVKEEDYTKQDKLILRYLKEKKGHPHTAIVQHNNIKHFVTIPHVDFCGGVHSALTSEEYRELCLESYKAYINAEPISMKRKRFIQNEFQRRGWPIPPQYLDD